MKISLFLIVILYRVSILNLKRGGKTYKQKLKNKNKAKIKETYLERRKY